MASKSNGVESSEWARAPPAARPLGERVLRAIYDPDDKTFLGRTPKRWGIVILFYLVFYAVLVAFFGICMAGLFSQIDDKKPMYTLESSLIGVNPGVTCRPRPHDDVTVQYSTENSTSFEYYTKQLEDFLQRGRRPRLSDIVPRIYNILEKALQGTKDEESPADPFEAYANESWVTSKKECTYEDNFGYPDAPCFFIKLNKIYGWKPQYYESDFPEDMPADLVQYITMLPAVERQQLWVSCWLEHDTGATLQYPWGRGLAGRFYPFLNQRGYTPPALAVRITPPVNVLNIIRCRVWAKNVIYNKSIKEGTGYVRILLQVDNPEFEDATTSSQEQAATNTTAA